MTSATIKVIKQNGVFIQAPGSNAYTTSNSFIILNKNASILTNQKNVPTIPSQMTGKEFLNGYSNTAQMLANDATTYANSVNYTNQMIANIHLSVSQLSDVLLPIDPPANNSTLVYDTTNNKYVVEQMNVDGGTF
jgi:hypothetical protein